VSCAWLPHSGARQDARICRGSVIAAAQVSPEKFAQSSNTERSAAADENIRAFHPLDDFMDA